MSVALDPRDFVLLSLEARNRGFKSTRRELVDRIGPVGIGCASSRVKESE